MEYNKIKFVIIGGGTAGWISALYLKKFFPDNLITVIESSEIGILGAGEGTTPHFIFEFLEDVGISINDFIKNTKATIKNGIKFTNWHGDGDYYFHPFSDGPTSKYTEENNIFAIDFIANGKNLKEICLSDLCSLNNKLKHYHENDSFQVKGNFALHFDARLTANYLKEVAISRGIVHIDDKVVSSIHNDVNFKITNILLESGNNIECDFVVDCTGFSRKLIGGVFKEKWIDYKNSLPVDRALPFFIPNESEIIPPYTESIAMKYGWVWKIPVQGRFGCGYVFDSDYVSDEEIKNEIIEKFGQVEIPRFFSFKAGCFENTWSKNCVALGLSAGFIEPLEATSIWVTIASLKRLLQKYVNGIVNDDETEKKLYNNFVRAVNEEIKDFIQLHYLTNRNDTPFWKEYRTKNRISKNIKDYDSLKTVDEILEHSKKTFTTFSIDIYSVYDGVKIYDREIFKKHFDSLMKLPENKDYAERMYKFKKELYIHSQFKSIDHYEFLEHIKHHC